MSDKQSEALKALMATALLDRDVVADAARFGLRDLTQIAALLRPGRTMIVANADALSPIERAGIASAAPGRVSFGDAG